MEVKTLLLSIIFVHTCEGSERNFAVMTETYDTTENDSFSGGMLKEDDSGDYSTTENDSFSGETYKVKIHIPQPPIINGAVSFILASIPMFPDPIVQMVGPIEEIIPVSQPCNSSDQNGVKYNKTTQDAYNITDDAILFLKGLMVTRLMPSFYIIIILISLPLNALAFVMFTCRIREKKPAVIYMAHLACVDLLFTLLLPLKIHYHLNASDWVFGEAACRALSAAYYCYMYCSILLMMCMSVDRLLAVVFPIASLTWRSTRKATCICAFVWLLAVAGTAPLLFITQTFKIKDVGVTCHDVLYDKQLYVYLFSLLSCLYFFLPLVVTIVSYSTMIYALTMKNDNLKTSSSDKRRRAVIMTVAVLMEFVMCFAPTNGILFYHCVRLATRGSSEEGKYYLIVACLGSASVFLDPLLYYYGSSQCRKQIRSLIWWRKAKSTSSPSITNSQTKSSNLSCEYTQARIKV
ncbi:proteinase-activated receptor 1-like isoform X2 [Labeo rohita]|uniref:proteinase-activated receptor 1-like isoform X2 n=1 Tax=Labeo rohita TaxID=84645 RepID=UPI0021E29AF8|nr:proteinase-activated receptor 1-like isoform X2 [Labeo rohita]